MQMHDALRHLQGGTVIADLAAAFDLAPSQAEAALHAVASSLVSFLEATTLSRGGLADLVEALGSPDFAKPPELGSNLRDGRVGEQGKAILGRLLGPISASARSQPAPRARPASPRIRPLRCCRRWPWSP